MKMKFTDLISFVGTTPSNFDGEKAYISTGAVDNFKVTESEIEMVTYDNRPSRANLTAKTDDVLFAKMAETLKTLRINYDLENCIFSTGFCAVRANRSVITPQCLYYLVSSPAFLEQKDKHASGATQRAITNSGMENISINIPPLSEQGDCTKKLDSLTLLIAKRKDQLSQIDKLVKSQFIALFGNVILNERDWDMYVFSDIASSRLGKMLDGKRQTGECAYPYLANFNVQWFRFELDNLNTMDFNEDDRLEFALEDGDLLVCEGGEIGRCAVWHQEKMNCYFQKALHRVRCNREFILPDYMAWWFKYNCDNNGFAAIEGAKATIAHLPGAKLKKLMVAVPPMELQIKFANFVEQSDKSKFRIKQSLEKLEICYKALLQKYFG